MMTYPNINPVALDLGFVSIHWYGVSYVIGILFAWILLRFRSSRSELLLKNDQIADLVFFVMLGIVSMALNNSVLRLLSLINVSIRRLYISL